MSVKRSIVPFFSKITLCVFLLFQVISCNVGEKQGESDSQGNTKDSLFVRDLEDIQKEGVLRAITMYSSTNYFLYRGQIMGYEYELLQRVAEHLHLKLEIIIANNINDLIEKLIAGEGDVVAAGLTVTNERKYDVRFTDYLYLTKQVLVQRKPKNWRYLKEHEIDAQLIKDPIQLIGDTVVVTKNSSFYSRLKNLEDELGGNINIKLVDGSVPSEKLIKMVVDEKIKYTVADNNVANINASYYPILDISTAISFSQRIAWAVRKDSPQLYDTLNYWITKMKRWNAYYAIYDKYFKSPNSFQKRLKSEFYGEKTGKISPYDDLIKKYTKSTTWDWRLISSLIYQESQFDPEANSWAAASGLMQLMPETALEMGVNDMTNAEENVRGGIKYLRILWKQWDSIEDSIQRLKFTFASYNCGLNHVIDAQKLAVKYDMDEKVWDGNVEEQIFNLSYPAYYRDPAVKYGYVRGGQTVAYVRDIFERYEQYLQFIPAE